MTADVLVPLMFASLVIALIAGFPVAFSIAAVAALFGAIGIATGHLRRMSATTRVPASRRAVRNLLLVTVR